MSKLLRVMAPVAAAAWLVLLPAMALASPEAAGGHGAEHSDGIVWTSDIINNTGKTGLLWLFINFAVLMWILNKVLFSKLKVTTAQKSDAIKEELARATEARADAESIITEYRGRMDRLDGEIDELMSDAKRRAESDRTQILEAATREAERIKAAATAAAEREAQTRKRAIENEIVDAAVQRAEAVIRSKIGAADQRKMVDDYVGSLGEVNFAGPGGAR